MKRPLPQITLAITILILTTLSCKTGSGVSSLLQSEESAAREYFLKEVWEKKFKRCGDFYYSCVGCKAPNAYFGNAIVAIKTSPGQWTLERIELSPADDANNIAWAGNLTVKAALSTYYNRNTKEWMQFWNGTAGFQHLLLGSSEPIFEIVRYKNGTYSAFIKDDYLLRAWNETDSGNGWEMAQISNCDEVPPRN